MTVNDWVKVVHGNAVNKGFWEAGTNLSAEQKLSKHMLMVGELAEASESVRNAELPYFLNGTKPDGEAVEIADCIIRCFDYAGAMGWDLEKIIAEKHKYNTTRPHKHGKTV
jgi:NTP pyrophosphatase (non-canonical NTP hydrolase)